MDSLKLMETSNKNYSFIKNKYRKRFQFNAFLYIILFILYFYIIYFLFKIKNSIGQISYLISNLNTFFNYSKSLIKDINNTNEKGETNIHFLGEYIKRQNDFCDNPNKYIVSSYEELIKLTNFSFKGLSYQIYVYKKYDKYMSNNIIKTAMYEPIPMSNFLEALQFYSEKKKIINKKEIFMLDIGGNIGAHTIFIGKLGFSVITFEASPRNFYILNKNYCNINRNSNIVLINKGISNEEGICNYYSQIDGIGNGILLCDENNSTVKTGGYTFNKTFEVSLTKLSKFIPYLSSKNLALIKLDIEGGEGKAIEDGIELINKIHVPFIFSEFNPRYLRKHKSDPKKFLRTFIENGYKISKEGFFGTYFNSIEEIKFGNLYFTYNGN